MIILKCTDCGNTFKNENAKKDEIISCPVCEAQYTISIKDGKIKLKDFVYENE